MVTKPEYLKVEKGMSRERVERIFGAGRGCEYVSYELSGVLYTGRVYRNTKGNWVAIRFAVREDGIERVRGKQWDTVGDC